MHVQERRSAKRFPLELQGYAIINGSSVDLKTHDVSPEGALVKLGTHFLLKNGTKLLVRLKIGFMGRAIIFRVNTCDNRTLYSLKFDRFDSYSDLILIAYLIKYEHHLPAGPTPTIQ
jgi:hypothetical protein